MTSRITMNYYLAAIQLVALTWTQVFSYTTPSNIDLFTNFSPYGYRNIGVIHRRNGYPWSGFAKGSIDAGRNIGVGGGLSYSRKNKERTWSLGVEGDYFGRRDWGLSSTYRYDRGNFGGHISGKVNSRGNYGFSTGINYRWKRSAEIDTAHFNVTLRADPCFFDMFDLDRNGFITKPEFRKIFGSSATAKGLFNALDKTTGDGILERREFETMSSKVITSCGPSSD